MTAVKGGSDQLLSSSTANENGAWEVTVDLEGWEPGLYSVAGTGDQGKRAAGAFLLVDKVAD